MLYYHKFSSSLKNRGLTVSPYDLCVWNRDIVGKQIWICFRIDDCKISHLDPEVVDCTMPGCVMRTRVYLPMAAA